MVTKSRNGISVKLVTSKSRVAPLNCVTLPRVELLGALVAARLASNVKKIVNFKRSCLQCHSADSKIVLFWIKCNKTQWKQFVANRVNEITSLTDPHSWYHCAAKYFVSENIDWKFIPPKSPHFGGLWEAGVKSVKHHLKRAIGNLHFTFEEFETIMIQVEGILNSRPLTPLSSDANNFDVLAPGHLLIGRPITSIPEPNLIDVNENRLSRWEKITKVAQRTWKKWKSDYLNILQARLKWITEKNDLIIGQMVLIKEDFLPINTWPLGKILEVYHGSDGKVRVVKVKTQSGEFKRAISKIAVLPIDTK
ncbi:uncharacterized protein TNCV_5083801 [Trichonephila clavipes]|uniref:DUF5641 domain-containing protein n=1 Tax=Trichonephila clavipes TaxID=2585209 RepID=A0A8X6SGV4_TRICX|nr:uncharacterized protein TNCV_5083801 [Trichonephila clavipes]